MLDKLTKIAICKGLSAAQAQELAAIAEETQAKKGERLFNEGDAGDSILCVLEGQIDIVKSDQQLAIISDGSVLGEMSLLGEGGKRTASATALTDVKLWKINAGKFRTLLAADNVTALKVVGNLAGVIAKRLLAMNEKLIDSPKGKKKEELADFQKILSNWSF
jgi:CRP/FNR family transcriptional regulator, cyclic AMP receptor protein